MVKPTVKIDGVDCVEVAPGLYTPADRDLRNIKLKPPAPTPVIAEGVESLYGFLRRQRWTYEDIANSTDEQILIFILALHREKKAVEDAQRGGSSNDLGQVSPEQRARMTEEQHRAGYERFGMRLGLNPKDPETKAAIDQLYADCKKREQVMRETGKALPIMLNIPDGTTFITPNGRFVS